MPSIQALGLQTKLQVAPKPNGHNQIWLLCNEYNTSLPILTLGGKIPKFYLMQENIETEIEKGEILFDDFSRS